MVEKRKRPVARRTLYLAIEDALTEYDLDIDVPVGALLDKVKDAWFKQAK